MKKISKLSLATLISFSFLTSFGVASECSSEQINMNFKSGWNLISSPLDREVNVFELNAKIIYGYDAEKGEYFKPLTLKKELGYWANFSSETDVCISKKDINGVEPIEEPMVGNFGEYRAGISDEEKAVLEKALNGLTGVTYKPILVSTQVVAGMNYKFVCISTVVYPDAPSKLAIVNVYEALDGKVELGEIQDISF